EVADGILGYPFERVVGDYIATSLGLLRTAGASLPVVVLLTLAGVKGRWVVPPNAHLEVFERRDFGGPSFDRDLVLLPDVMVDDWATDVFAAMRPAFDAFWQASGKNRSPNYDGEGIWQRRE